MSLDLLCKCKEAFQRELIIKYRNKHLATQQSQRDAMDKMMAECRKFDHDHNPVKAFILSDAITEKRGNTPIFRSFVNDESYKPDDNKSCFGDRMFGSLVVCGDINAYFLFHCHDFVGGGANIAIEILRLTLMKLAELLAERNQKIPKHLALQGDNCGENKNKYMFAYLSLLVEMCIFDTISFSFLIVGHTHCIIDQWFSVITKIILSAKFIGTPYAMEELLKVDREKSTFSKPIHQQHIHGVPDFKTAFEGVVNTDIKFYQV